MALSLTAADHEMLAGARGPAVQMAMSIVVQMAEVAGAVRLLDITAAHIDSTIYVGQATLEFAERLAALDARVVVPSTTNVSGVDELHWREWAVPPGWVDNAQRQMAAYRRMGCIPIWSCAPYQTEYRPRFGQQIAWGESNAILFANSILGARTERYPDLLDICCAITGRVPAAGLHLTENRAGQVLFRLIGVPLANQQEDSFYPVLGHVVGKAARDRIPVVAGLEMRPTEDQLKALCAALASSGPTGLLHLLGITPEAPTLEAALQGRAPANVIDITMDELRAARRELTTAEDDALDMVIVGCPHFSLQQFADLAALVVGRKAHSGVRFLVNSSRAIAEQARRAGYLSSLEAFGVKVTVDTCPLASPMLPPEVKAVMTDSAKHAYYAPGLLKVSVSFGSLVECVESAVRGHIVRESWPWAS